MSPNDTSAPAIQVTEAARAEIRRLMEQEGLPAEAGVRVAVKGGGCSGFTYSLNFDPKPASGDEVLDFDGVRLFVDPKSLLYLRGTTLDYSSGLQGKGFQFQNPNATGTCGCGESFAV